MGPLRQSLGLTIVAALWAAVAAIFVSPGSTLAYEVAKFCRSDADQVVILVDVTTAFDERSKELFQRGISAIVASLDPGESLQISTIEDSFASAKLLYRGCVPYCSSGLLDWLFSDCTDGLIRVETGKQQNQIGAALRDRLELATEDLETSDILRTMFYATEHRSDAHLQLYVFSDLIENSEFMAGKIFWSQSPEKSMKAIRENGFMPDLSQSTVRVFGVGRGGSSGRHPLAQDRILKLHEFWEAYFKAARAIDTEISEELYLP